MKIRYGSKKANLFDVSLMLLVFLSEISYVEVFSNMAYLNTIINILQLPLYAALIYIISAKRYSFKQLLVFTALGLILLIGYVQSGQAAFFKSLLLVLAAKNESYKKIMKYCRISTIVVICIAILTWPLVFSESNVFRRNGLALGFGHPNVTAQFMMVSIFLWIAEKGENLKRKDFLFVEAYGLIVYAITRSRTTTILIMALPVVVVIIRKAYSRKRRHFILDNLCKFSQLFLLLFTYITAATLEHSKILNALDLILANRIFLNYYGLKNYGISLFGQNVTLVDNSGTVYNNIRNAYNWSVTIDSGYMVALLKMGLLPTLIFCLGYYVVMKRAVKMSNYMVASIAIMLAIYSFTESRMLDIYFNFVYFYILADYCVPCVLHDENHQQEAYRLSSVNRT